MTIRDVVQLGEPSLWEAAAPVGDPAGSDVEDIVQDLHDTLVHWRRTTTYGRAIAAPQIAVSQRIIVADLGAPWPLVNAAVVRRSAETIVVWDACLSFLDIFCKVVRHRWIDVAWQDLTGEWHERRMEGELSELFQHEIDHLDGMLALGRMVEIRSMCRRDYFETHHRARSPYADMAASTPTPCTSQ